MVAQGPHPVLRGTLSVGTVPVAGADDRCGHAIMSDKTRIDLEVVRQRGLGDE